MTYRVIDLTVYPRRAHFEHFMAMPQPFVGVTVNVDVTGLRAECRARGASFTLAFLHAAALAANAVPELRQRVRDGGIVEYDACGTSHIELLADGTYGYCTLWHDRDWDAYLPYAEAERRACVADGSIAEDADVDALYFVTCLPGLRFTDFIQPTDPAVSNPHISWGRFEPGLQGRWTMPVNLLAHHALVDGVHMTAFFRELEARLAVFRA